ncbi:MAG: hypothetical protein CVU34_08675 [Betaproteobacteria bacterium HGW-Betaproteobacteria-7]|jgi:rhodanese-related sulfurtransferase|nr:MAG: hypothetical protein CVU34_08675 [Betaproteobacteria bacterium HGW-Betaproteobacteria-7]
MKARLAGCLLALSFCLSAWAEVPLLAGQDLAKALQGVPPCCVIDGRRELNRVRAPLSEALPYRPGLKIKPTASVVVLADSDGEALRIAAVFEKQHPGKRILAVKGGVQGWLAAKAAAGEETHPGAPGAGIQFVIPHNTCETGEPLQKLQSNKK